MMKTILITGLILLLALELNSIHKSVDKEEAYKIGAILPLTGDLADIGEEVNRGALLAVERLNKEGIQIKYIPEDDAFNPALSVSAANKLIHSDKVDAVFTAVVEEAKPTMKIFNDSSTPLLVTWDSNNDLKSAGKDIFSIGFSTEKSGEVMANFAYDTLHLRKVAIISAVDPGVDLMIPSFIQTFEERGGAIVLNEKVSSAETDNRTIIAKLKGIQFDGLYMPLIPPQYGPFLKQIRAQGFKQPLMAVDSFIKSEINSAGSAAEGVYFSNIYAKNSDEITKEYKSRFGKSPIDPSLVAFGYDGILTLVKAEKIAKEQSIPLNVGLAKVKIEGMGSEINMNGGNFSDRVEKIFQVKEGKLVEIK